MITGRLLVGAYPGAVADDTNEKILRGILSLGVCTFVCLQEEYVHDNVAEEQWRAGEERAEGAAVTGDQLRAGNNSCSGVLTCTRMPKYVRV